MSEKHPVIAKAEHVTKEFLMPDGRTLRACDDVSLSFQKGQTLGIVGESGCGKSTFLKLMMLLEKPTRGSISFDGEECSKLKGENLRQHRKKVQMVFQDPKAAFHPGMKVRDIICEPLRNFKLISRKEKDAVAKQYLKMVELPEEFLERYPHQMSGGQRQRVAIARALTLESELLICDEATSALDVSVQNSILKLLTKLQREKQISIAFVCHDIILVSQVAHEIAVMYLGTIVERLSGENFHKEARHPYTKALMESVLYPGMDLTKERKVLTGEVPFTADVPSGCPFHPRCPHCMERCRREKPSLKEVRQNHLTACFLFY